MVMVPNHLLADNNRLGINTKGTDFLRLRTFHLYCLLNIALLHHLTSRFFMQKCKKSRLLLHLFNNITKETNFLKLMSNVKKRISARQDIVASVNRIGNNYYLLQQLIVKDICIHPSLSLTIKELCLSL